MSLEAAVSFQLVLALTPRAIPVPFGPCVKYIHPKNGPLLRVTDILPILRLRGPIGASTMGLPQRVRGTRILKIL